MTDETGALAIAPEVAPLPLCVAELLLSEKDEKLFRQFVPDCREPDLVIAPDGRPYLYRWWVIPRNHDANVYFHIQIADDPERPLHDHPWDNQSVILSGGYVDTCQQVFPFGQKIVRTLKAGQVYHRRAEWAHRLTILPGAPYTMTLFATGPTVRDWGFWVEHPKNGKIEWFGHTACLVTKPDGRSVFVNPYTKEEPQ